MNCRTASIFFCATILAAIFPSNATYAQTNPFTKGQVADRIRKVEDGVDEFEKYSRIAETTPKTGRNRHRVVARQRAPAFKFSKYGGAGEPSEGNKRRSRKRYGRFKSHHEPTSTQVRSNVNYLETKAQMEQVMDSARRVNQVITKGNYGTQAERYWTALRTNINDLARCYNLTPMGV